MLHGEAKKKKKRMLASSLHASCSLPSLLPLRPPHHHTGQAGGQLYALPGTHLPGASTQGTHWAWAVVLPVEQWEASLAP